MFDILVRKCQLVERAICHIGEENNNSQQEIKARERSKMKMRPLLEKKGQDKPVSREKVIEQVLVVLKENVKE